MRKQKASDKRTRRQQLGGNEENAEDKFRALTQSPMQQRGQWNDKGKVPVVSSSRTPTSGGRGRSRKRSTLYSTLSFYHDKFLTLLTHEYKSEEKEVLGRIQASLDNPVMLEQAGFALYDMYPTRRGNLFSDEVYRLTKSNDATTTYHSSNSSVGVVSLLPNHKFSVNDIIILTRQPRGSGDLFDPSALPISETAQKLEAHVLALGPTYVDIVVGAGAFESSFGRRAPNDDSGTGDRSLRVRVDLFFSPIPYQRMVTALAQATSPTMGERLTDISKNEKPNQMDPAFGTDEVIRDLFISTHAFGDPSSPLHRDPSVCNIDEVARMISKPPTASSHKLAQEVVKTIQSSPQRFRSLNAPQLAAVQAALTRRCTLIQGPPGTGKTTVASAIGFGFVRKCKSVSVHSKVLACAFSNVGADNLAEALMKAGLRIVRIGKPSAVAVSLWNNTIDAAVGRDVDAQQALQEAAKATATLAKLQRHRFSTQRGGDERETRQAATSAVQASIQFCNLAATRAFREADVIVSTLTGAADARLLAACGLEEDGDPGEKSKGGSSLTRTLAPDGLPPLSLPFVIVDEACQSAEPASFIPVFSSDSCRSLVLLGDPCQLPPTVLHSTREKSPLSVSLMERLATVLPPPNILARDESAVFETSFIDSKPIREARSVVLARYRNNPQRSYRKRFAGSFLLTNQYRMHPSIAALPSAIYYDGLLSTPKDLLSARPFPDILKSMLPCQCTGVSVRVVNIGGRSNELRESDLDRPGVSEKASYANAKEASFVVDLIHGILADEGGCVGSLATISPYSGQVSLIQSQLQADTERSNTTVEIKSVDSFQGKERDIVIFSAVRSNREGRIGFLKDWRRLNVALTRARKGLVVVGDFDTLAPADTNWAALQKWAIGAKCALDARDAPVD